MSKKTVQCLLEITRDTILAAKYCFLITLDEEGQPNARLMQPFEPDEELVIHFGASSDSRKVQEIKSEPRVTLGYALTDEGAYVTLQGMAEIVTDTEIKSCYWRDSFVDYWPEGASSDGYAVIRFTSNRVEVMNFKHNVAPDPYGLKPASLVRISGAWEIEYA